MPGFLAPLFIIGSLAAAVPIVLHFLKRQPEATVKFAAVRMLQAMPVEHASRRRLREWLLLALRVSALVLLSLAFARPFLATAADTDASGLVVVALDTSFSLSSPGRLEHAKSLARDAISRVASEQLVAVVTFADDARIAVHPTVDRARAVAAIEAAAIEAGATRYRPAIAAAGGLIAERTSGAGTIVVVSDLQAAGWSSEDTVIVPGDVQIELVDVGPLATNLSVAEVGRTPNDGVTATVRNYGPEARDVHVQLVIDGTAAGSVVVRIPAGQAGRAAFAAETAGKLGEVRIEDGQGLQEDNVRYVVLDENRATPILVVTSTGDLSREAFYAEQALLAAGPSGAAYAVEGVGADVLSGWPLEQLDRFAAVAILATRGLDRRGRDLVRDYVDGGGRLFVVMGPGMDADVVGGSLGRNLALTMPADVPPDPRGSRTLTPVDVRHPVFRGLGVAGETLGLVAFRQVASVSGNECDLLAKFTTGEVALIECARDGARTLVFASDINQAWNDFPRHGTFVPFLHEVMAYLSEGRGRRHEYYVGNVPAGVAATPGFATLEPGQPQAASRVVAVNVDPSESEPARLTPTEFLASVTRPAPGQERGPLPVAERTEVGQQFWRYLLILMMAALVFESLLSRRMA
jgi:hypothetical protein